MNYERSVFHLGDSFSLATLPYADANIRDEVAYTSYRDKAQKNQFDLSGSARFIPVTPQAVFLLLAGFVGGWTGFTAFFACLFLGGNGKNVIGSIVLTVLSIIVFHRGLILFIEMRNTEYIEGSEALKNLERG